MRRAIGFIVCLVVILLMLCGTASAELPAPTNLVLTEPGILTWDKDENVSRYFYAFRNYDNGKLVVGSIAGSIYNPNTSYAADNEKWTEGEDGKISFDFTSVLRDRFIELGLTRKPIMIQVELKPYAQNSQSGPYSDYSNQITIQIDAEVPEIAAPENLSMDSNGILTWDPEEGLNISYSYKLTLKGGGKQFTKTGTIYNPELYPTLTKLWNEENEKRSFDMSSEIQTLIINNDLIGKSPSVTVTLKPTCRVEIDGNIYNMEGPDSEASNSVVFIGTPNVETVSIVPASPVLYAGHSLTLEIMIAPEDAFYSTSQWSSSDDSVVQIVSAGKIKGLQAGTANVTVSIGNASTTIPVTVCTVLTNISSTSAQKQVTDIAGKIIEQICNQSQPDLTGTDISSSQVETLRTQIFTGIARGDEFHADLVLMGYSQEQCGSWMGEIAQIVPDGSFACANRIGFEMYQKDSAENCYPLGNIISFSNATEVFCNLPELPAPEQGYRREYHLIQILNGKAKEIPVTISQDGRFSGKVTGVSDWVLMYKDTEVVLNIDKGSYLLQEEVHFSVSPEDATDYRLYVDSEQTSSGSFSPYDRTIAIFSNNLGVGEHTCYMEVSFDNGSTWVQSRNVTFEVVQLGEASFQATFQHTIITQGRDLVIELSESEHIDYYYLSWESGYNPNQPHFDGNSQEIRISTLGMKPGLHDVFLGARPQPGYQTPEPINAFINIGNNNNYETGRIYFDGPETVEAGKEAIFMIYARDAQYMNVYLDSTSNYPARYLDPGHSYLVWLSADQTGEHTIIVEAKVNGAVITEQKTFQVICSKDLKLTGIEMPERIFCGQPVSIPVRKPADADSMDVYVYYNDQVLIDEKNLTEDYTISLTGEQTRNIRLIAVNISAWYQGRILSNFSDSCWVDDVAEFVSFSASRDACKPNEEIICTLSIFRDLSNALIVAGEESYQLDTNRLYDGAEHEQTITFTQPGTYTAYARICLSDGTWVNTDPVIITVSEVWSEPTYSWEGFVCTARAVNPEDENQVLEETVTAEKIITLSPTQQTAGAYTLRASFENAVFSVQEKEDNGIPALKDLEVLVLPADLKRIEAEAFSETKAQAVILPDGCTTIETGAFSSCEQLIYAYIPSSVISIGEGAFEKTVILDFGK